MPDRQKLANAIRALSMDAVNKAQSGHPGMPMGMADIAEVLWNDFLVHDPQNPTWWNRDRFMLSNGHGAMLQYALLHLTGYEVSLADLARFRQWDSKTPGHPEYGHTPGVETTTGPLGQGFANAVGMAIAQKQLAATFNRPQFPLFDHFTYVLMGDGCMMEGISHEAASLAGVLGLGKLIAFYDDNGISIDGPVAGWFKDHTPKRFEAYGWHVIPKVDGHDPDQIKKAIMTARNETNRPTLICCQTVIGFGAPTLAGDAATHGAPLPDDELAGAKAAIDWTHRPFEIPDEIYQQFDAKEKGAAVSGAWQQLLAAYQKAFPEEAKILMQRFQGKMPDDWATLKKTLCNAATANEKPIATRKASQQCLNVLGNALPALLGGSADLTGSNGTLWKGADVFNQENPKGNYLYYGVREFAMSAIMNGMALHGGFIPFGGTFLVFNDYARNAVRLCALMKKQVIFVYTHDSIGLGEDGPTHQPIEQLPSLRLMPNMTVWRPADPLETACAWIDALENNQNPTSLILSRQALPIIHQNENQVEKIKRGGYILKEPDAKPMGLIIATGSEVGLALQACALLAKENVPCRVVSMPCVERFLAQDEAYQREVLPRDLEYRLVVEAAAPDPWYRFVNHEKGMVMGLSTFGASAPYQTIYEHRGLTAENVKNNFKLIIQQSN